MVYAFLLGIAVTLTPSLLAVAWLVWRADTPVVREKERFGVGRVKVDATTKPNNRSCAKSSPTRAAAHCHSPRAGDGGFQSAVGKQRSREILEW
jgi:hypothetical protein